MTRCTRCRTVNANRASVCHACGNRGLAGRANQPAAASAMVGAPGPSTPTSSTPPAPPVPAAPVIELGPASEPRLHQMAGLTAAGPVGSLERYPIVVGTGSPATRHRGATISAFAGGSLVLVLLIGMLALLAARPTPATPPATVAPATVPPTVSPAPTPPPTAVPKASLAPISPVTAGSTANVTFSFSGDPTKVRQTVPVINGGFGDPKDGLVNPVPVSTSIAGTVSVQVKLVLDEGEVTSDSQSLVINAPASPPTQPPAPVVRPRPRHSSPSSDGGVATRVREDNVAERLGSNRSSTSVGNLMTGDIIWAECLVAAEYVPEYGERTWVRLTNGHYVLDHFVRASVPHCPDRD